MAVAKFIDDTTKENCYKLINGLGVLVASNIEQSNKYRDSLKDKYSDALRREDRLEDLVSSVFDSAHEHNENPKKTSVFKD